LQSRPPDLALFGMMPALSGPPDRAIGKDTDLAVCTALSAAQQDDINRVFSNTGKSIAAFERTLLPLENRLDRYVAAILVGQTPTGDATLTQQEIDGFKIFAGKGECIKCHNGPRFTDAFFHNTGVTSPQNPVVDFGRAQAIAQVEADEFNCLGPYSDADPAQCAELRFMSRDMHLFERAYKTPSLRGVADRPPYMHAGQLSDLPSVIEHYNRALPSVSGHSELNPLGLSAKDKADLQAFLEVL